MVYYTTRFPLSGLRRLKLNMRKTIKNLVRNIMKTVGIFTVIVLVACHDEDSKQPFFAQVLIADPKLKQCIDDSGLEAQLIEVLNCSAYGISSLEGIESLEKLKVIDLSNNQIVDLTPLASLIQRQKANKLNKNEIATADLIQIDLSANQIINASKIQILAEQIEIKLLDNPLSTLPAPGVTVAVSGDEKVTLRWQRVLGANAYNVYVSETPDGLGKALPMQTNSTRFELAEKTNDTPLYFVISAIFPQGEGIQSSLFTATPNVPTTAPSSAEIVYARADSNSIFIDWAESNNYEKYQLLFSSDAEFTEANTTIIDDVKPPSTLPNLTEGTRYFVKIKSINPIGESESNVLTIATESVASKPLVQDLAIEAGLGQNILSWSLSPAYSAAKLFFAVDRPASQSDVEFANPSSPFTHPGINADVEYHYLLVATGDGVEDLQQAVQARPLQSVDSVIIEDLALKQCLADSGYKAVKDVVSLQCQSKKIANLNGLDIFTNLESLNLNNNKINDISPIGKLNKLVYLNLSNNRITDLSALGTLIKIRTLQLQNNTVRSLVPLNTLVEITGLGISDNPLANLSGLENLVNITRLQLSGSGVKDISPLTTLVKLTHISLADNKIENISALANLSLLVYLDLSKNNITDFSVLTSLKNLRFITQTNNQAPAETPKNNPPVASVGSNIVINTPDEVILDGSNSSDEDGDALTYSWSIVSAPTGSVAQISDVTIASPGFIPDVLGNYEFNLVISDGQADSEAVVLSLEYQNQAPVAQIVESNDPSNPKAVVLDGSDSFDANLQTLTFSWQIVSAPDTSVASISTPTEANINFVPDVFGEYVLSLVVNDGLLESEPVLHTFSYENSAPVARAQNQIRVKAGQQVQLDASNSTDIDGDALNYLWTLDERPQGSNAIIENETSLTALLAPDIEGDYKISLVVNDGNLDSATHNVIVTFGNVEPMANAGVDIKAQIGEIVTLDGSNSTDEDGDVINYQWSLTVPENSTATLNEINSLRPNFSVDVAGNYTAELSVADSSNVSPIQIVEVDTNNVRPIANAGFDQVIQANDTVQLNASLSTDVDEDKLSYAWSLLEAPENSVNNLSSSLAIRPTLNTDVAGTYVVQLSVNDGVADSDPVTIKLTTENIAPIANAGEDQTASVDDLVELNASASFDANGDSLTYVWSLISKPSASSATLSSTEDAISHLSIDAAGDHVVQLIVSDGVVSSRADTIVISTSNSRPVAVVGAEHNIIAGDDPINLDGSNSVDADADELNFRWSLLRQPPLSKAIISNPNIATPVFDPLWEGEYIAQLQVDDGVLKAQPVTTYIKVNLGPDDDNDGLNNQLEVRFGSDPNNPDSDGDGLNDGDEVKEHATDPIDEDSDGDGLKDGAEINDHSTDPLNEDSDDDGLSDGQEIVEYATDPNKVDSDGDGWNDYDEVIGFETNANSKADYPKLSIVNKPENISVLRTGVNDDPNFEITTITSLPQNVNVLRAGVNDDPNFTIGTVTSLPQDVSVLRAGVNDDPNFNIGTVTSLPQDVSVLRAGVNDDPNFTIGTVTSLPQDISVLRTGVNDDPNFSLGTVIANPEDISLGFKPGP